MMNEETEQFEQRLSRQPLKEIPSVWRAEILSAALDVGAARSGDSEERRHKILLDGGFLPKAATPAWFKNLLWPHPVAWAGLAAVWILIFAVDFSMRDKSPMMAEKISPPSPEIIAELKKEHLMYAELIGARDISDADRSKLRVPSPRTERVEILTA
jgi:hypothetical protein